MPVRGIPLGQPELVRPGGSGQEENGSTGCDGALSVLNLVPPPEAGRHVITGERCAQAALPADQKVTKT